MKKLITLTLAAAAPIAAHATDSPFLGWFWQVLPWFGF